ncbi:MAG TPA: ABC transporter ATP-binding protein [Gaiellaceae bacterium]|nr:ABC transporter ATP-binding protein [Gaiellaceae bacterium]
MTEFARGVAAILAYGWRASPGRLVGAFALLALSHVSRPVGALVLKEVTDAVVAGDVRGASYAAAALPLLTILGYSGHHLSHVIWVELQNLFMLRLNDEIGVLTQGATGLEHHERPDYADRLELLRAGGNELIWSARVAAGTIGLAAQFALTVVLLAQLQPLLLLLLLFAIPPLAADRWGWRLMNRAYLATADRQRLSTHLLDLAIREDAAKEIRIFGLRDEVERRLREARDEVRRALTRADRRGVAAQTVAQLVFSAAFVGALLLVVRGAVGGRHSVGDVVLVFTLAVQVNALVFNAVGSVTFLQRSTTSMGRLAWLRDLVRGLYPPTRDPLPVPSSLRQGIRVEGVGFVYPGTESRVLDGVDLELPAGATVAFVGENGAGKTTLVKLLCRFYTPTEGSITLDGVDLARFDAAEWRAQIAAGFQDFVRFEFVARESVGVGRLDAMQDDAAVTAAIERAAAGDVVAQLEHGLETQLGRAYADGAELSGGQWQKLALARAVMREAPLLLILDEPTSALDAHAEHALFERYAASAREVARKTGGIAIFVSHRFSTVRMADLIVVLDGGRIVERGTHAELVALGGLYAELYALQAAAYG